MASEKFCLRWNDFESNISLSFRELKDDKYFFDVTIVCEEDQLSAHKVILSACSQFFKDILRRNPHNHPLLYLKGVNLLDFKNVLNFMYHGEVSVAQEDLNTFLAVAEDLKVKGLTQGKPNPVLPSKPPAIPGRNPALQAPSRSKPQTLRDQTSLPGKKSWAHNQSIERLEDDDIQEVVAFKVEPKEVAPTIHQITSNPNHQNQNYNSLVNNSSQVVAAVEDYQTEGYEDYEQYEDYSEHGLEATYDGNKDVESLMSKRESGFVCLICQRVCSAKGNMKKHIESVHIPEEPQPCGFCEKKFKNKNSLQNHTSLSHRKQ